MNDFFTLDDACNITTGKLDSNAFVQDGKYPFYTCAENPTTIDSYAYNDDVILVAGNNAQGNFHINRFSGKFNAYQRTYILTIKDGYYLDYILYSLKLELKRLKEHAQGSQTKFLTISILKNIRFKNISYTEQQKIASTLSSLDKKIELNNQINQKLESMAKTLYDYWFVQFDFPDADGKPYKSSGGKMVYSEELKREIPEGWEVKRLGDISNIIAGGDKPKEFSEKETDNLKVPIYSNGIKNEGLYGFTDKERIIKPSITISARGTIGYCVLRNEPFVPIIRLISVTPNNDGLSVFFYHSIKNLVFENSGSVQQQLTVPQISALNIIFSTKMVLEKFEKITSPIIMKIENIKKQNQKLTQLRDWLLPMLMNGQVGVE